MPSSRPPRTLCSTGSILVLAMIMGTALLGCGNDDDPLGPTGQPAAEPLAKGPVAKLSGVSVVTSELVASFDGHRVPVTIHKPVEASEGARVPVLLHSHGWAGTRTSAPGAFEKHARAGFAVVSIDMRGHGDARLTSEARVHHVDFEIRDVSAVIDHVAGLPWVLLDAPGDPRLGSMGGSYGGGYQLLAAALDGRLDSLAPDITWSDLAQSLAPNGAPKSLWVDGLYGLGTSLARLHPDIHLGIASLIATNEVPNATVPLTPDLVTQFRNSSPAHYPDAIDVPTFIMQGTNDTLFNVNEGSANFARIAKHAPTKFVTHLGGHVFPIAQPPAAGSPCGDLTDLTIAWHQVHLLRERIDLGPRVCLALEDGTTITGDDFPLPGTREEKHSLAQDVGGEVTLPQLVPTQIDLPILRADDAGMVLAGIPRLKATASLTGIDAIVYFTLVAKTSTGERVLNEQVTPARLPRNLDGNALDLPLMAIGSRLKPNDELVLRVSTLHPQYVHNGGRLPGVVTLSDIEITVPIATLE